MFIPFWSETHTYIYKIGKCTTSRAQLSATPIIVKILVGQSETQHTNYSFTYWGPSAVSTATPRPKSTKTSIYCFLNNSTNDRMCLLSLTAPESNLGALYLSSFWFLVKRVDNAVRFPVLRSRQFWWFHILSHSQCRPFSWVGLDNTFDFSKGGGA